MKAEPELCLFQQEQTGTRREICVEAPRKREVRDAILLVCGDYFIFSPLSIPKVFDCETFNRGTSSFISVTKIK